MGFIVKFSYIYVCIYILFFNHIYPIALSYSSPTPIEPIHSSFILFIVVIVIFV